MTGSAISSRPRPLSAESPGPAYPARAYAWYVVAVLMAVTLLSLLDRQAPNLLVQQLRTDLGLSDVQISLLQGPAFALVFTFMGLPFGWLVDRRNRRTIMVIGVATWSGMTMLCGFAETFWQLFAARMGVGVGEAVLAPAAYSMLADYFRPSQRGRAIGIYFVSLAGGSGLSVMAMGALLRAIPHEPHIALGPLGSFAPWQAAFLAVGAPGLLAALALFTVHEPPRRNNAGTVEAGRGATFAEVLAYMGARRSTFLPVYFCYALIALDTLAIFSWAPTFYVRRFGLPISQVGLLLGPLLTCVGVAGALICGVLSDRWAGLRPGARFRLAPACLILGVPALALWPAVNDWRLSMGLFAMAGFALAFGGASGAAVVQDIAPARMRGQSMALFLVGTGLGGYALGPTLVALLTDKVFRDPQALGWSLAAVTAPAGLIAMGLAFASLKAYSRSRDEAS